jgi:hypothetical protein
MATATILEPTAQTEQLEAHKQEALAFAQKYQQVKVTDASDYEYASEALRQIVAKRKWWQGLVSPVKEAMHKAHAAVCAMEKTVDDPLARIELALKNAIKGYLAEEERKRRAEEDRLRKLALLAAESDLKKEADEAKLEMAIELEQSGNSAAAEAVLNTPSPTLPVYVPPIVLPSTVQKQNGISRKSNWKWRLIDESAVPREFLMVDEQKLNRFAKAMQDKARVAGIEFYDDGTIAVKV